MNFCRQRYSNMIEIQQKILLEVIKYLVEHGADAFNIKCLKTGKTAYDFVKKNLDDQIAKGLKPEGLVETEILNLLTTC